MQALEIEKMSTVERLQAMETLWDALTHERPEPGSPDWHRDVLKSRVEKIGNGEAEFMTLQELKARRNV